MLNLVKKLDKSACVRYTIANNERSEVGYFEGRGKGYNGSSMSINASLAYLGGEMPKSKWTKAAILQHLEDMDRQDLADKARALPHYVLLQYLKNTSVHHTSALFNQTRFWSFQIDWFDHADQEDFDRIIQKHAEKNPPKTREEREEASRINTERKQQKEQQRGLKEMLARVDRLSRINGMPSKQTLTKKLKAGLLTLAEIEGEARMMLKNEVKSAQKENAEMRAKLGFAPVQYDDAGTYEELKRQYGL